MLYADRREQIRIEETGGRLVVGESLRWSFRIWTTLFCLLFVGAGGLALHEGLASLAEAGSLPDSRAGWSAWALWLILLAVYLAIGVFAIFAGLAVGATRNRIIVEPGRDTITVWLGLFFVPIRIQRRSLKSFREVGIRAAVVRQWGGERQRFFVSLDGDTSLALASFGSDVLAREVAERIGTAAKLGVKTFT